MDVVEKELQELKEELKRLPLDHPERVPLQRRLAALEEQKLELLRRAAPPPGARKLTTKEFVEQPLPRLMQRVSDRASQSKTEPKHSRTFDGLELWGTFNNDVHNFRMGLDDKEARHKQLVLPDTTELDDGTSVFNTAPADEKAVFSRMYQILGSVSNVAASCGYDVQYIDAGSGRQMCNTDLLLRRRGTTDKSETSKLILGVIEVKGQWQLSLTGSNCLVGALQDPDKGKMAAKVIQQAYGDAVMDEAPLLVISNYEVTYFIKRDLDDVEKKRLWVSPPVSWDSKSPPPLAAWLFFAEYASQLWDGQVKSRLGRARVPLTPTGGYPVGAYFVDKAGWRQAPERQQPARGQQSSGREDQQQQEDHGPDNPNLDDDLQGYSKGTDWELGMSSWRASSGSYGSGSLRSSISSSIPESSSSRSSSQGGVSRLPDPQCWSALKQAGPAAVVDALNMLPDSVLHYTDWVLSATSSSVVVKGTVDGMPAAVKIYTLKETALSRFVHEVTAYLGMEQQSCIVPVLAVGRLPHNDRPVIALAEGQPVQEPLPSDLFAQAEEALKELHKAGWCHGDIRAGNMLCYNQHVVFCDLETCSPATEEGVKQDWHDLQSMLHEATRDQET